MQHEQLISREREIEHLQLLLAKLHRMQFGRKSEKLARQIEQLELRLEELESNRSEKESPPARTGLGAGFFDCECSETGIALCPIICRGKRARMCRRKRCVRNARVSCGSWVRTSRRCWSTCPPVSW